MVLLIQIYGLIIEISFFTEGNNTFLLEYTFLDKRICISINNIFHYRYNKSESFSINKFYRRNINEN